MSSSLLVVDEAGMQSSSVCPLVQLAVLASSMNQFTCLECIALYVKMHIVRLAANGNAACVPMAFHYCCMSINQPSP